MSLLRLITVAGATLAAACALVAPSGAAPAACGQTSYSYAGVSSIEPRFGVGASISTLQPPAVKDGHVAAWVGVGGAGLGPSGTDEWLQAGISVNAGQDPSLYYELALPGVAPQYVMLADHLPIGRGYKVAVLEARHRPGSWRVWVNGSRMTALIHLPGSHGAWRPIATAESWNGDTVGTCNGFAFAFAHVEVASRPGGPWQPLQGRVLADAGYRVERTASGGMLALGG